MAKSRQTKTDKVREMLSQPQGASLEAICKATGWQSHSARAVLSGFRKAGYTVERSTEVKNNKTGSVYRITVSPEMAT
ncbi:hypothetical protein FIU97_12605 [Roseivivax sp. THAF40]|uniref:DUF3489 domain-containing protein n=1 Tax=Roseivivax sp. THAF40 TaxID=2587858 RepID=UPI0012680CAC|nr:DUF3489 domain-containing protein [Roseivivax sp. THAF40]QFT47415.1 hypothetical protein FIU97_12605 [Roseivivax sp. THAF40]